MRKIYRSLLALMAAVSILSCVFFQTVAEPEGDVATIVAATLSAATFAVPVQTVSEPTPAGTVFTFPGGSMVIPEGLASSAVYEIIPQVNVQGGAPWEVAPQYVKITLQGYLLQDKFFQPQIMIYPAAEFAAVSEGAGNSIQHLQAILANPSQLPGNDAMPHLPYANAAQIIAAQPQVVAFQNGRGVRVLTEYAQYFAQINNHDLFYHFEGLTEDGSSYLVTTLPISAPLLAAGSDPASVAPAGGIPFPGYEATDESVFQNYYRSVTDLLNATSPCQFQPTLTLLDALIHSLEIHP